MNDIVNVGVYIRCQFRTCNGPCLRMCMKNKKVPHCFQHTNHKSLTKCANPECENGTSSATGYCNKRCTGVTQQALTLRNTRLIIINKDTSYNCPLCRCTVKCRYTHELGKKHKYKSLMTDDNSDRIALFPTREAIIKDIKSYDLKKLKINTINIHMQFS